MTPLGFVRHRRAANLVGAALYGSNWRPVHEVPAPLLVLWPLVEWDAPFTLIGGLDPADELLPEVERVFELIAKRAASGKLACVRFTYTGDVEGVDPAKWRSLGWRNFFDFDLRKGDRDFGRISRCSTSGENKRSTGERIQSPCGADSIFLSSKRASRESLLPRCPLNPPPVLVPKPSQCPLRRCGLGRKLMR